MHGYLPIFIRQKVTTLVSHKSVIFFFDLKNFFFLRFRLNGLELKKYDAKIMYKVFEGTPFECINFIFNDQTVYLFGTEPEALRALVNESSKYNWIKLLGN